MEDVDAAKLDYLQYLYGGPCLAIRRACYTQVFKAEACRTCCVMWVGTCIGAIVGFLSGLLCIVGVAGAELSRLYRS